MNAQVYIGIIAYPSHRPFISYVMTQVIDWMTDDSIQPVIIPYNIDEDELTTILSSLDGVVIPGSISTRSLTASTTPIELLNPDVVHTVTHIWNYATAEKLPILTICLGTLLLYHVIYPDAYYIQTPATTSWDDTTTSAIVKPHRHIWSIPNNRHSGDSELHVLETYTDSTSGSEHLSFISVAELTDFPVKMYMWHPELSPESSQDINVKEQFTSQCIQYRDSKRHLRVSMLQRRNYRSPVREMGSWKAKTYNSKRNQEEWTHYTLYMYPIENIKELYASVVTATNTNTSSATL